MAMKDTEQCCYGESENFQYLIKKIPSIKHGYKAQVQELRE